MKGMCCIVCFLTSNLERFQTLHNIFCIYFGNSSLKQSTGLPTTLNQQAALFIFAFHFCKQTPSRTPLNTEVLCPAQAGCLLVPSAPSCRGRGWGRDLLLLLLLLAASSILNSPEMEGGGTSQAVGTGQPRGL